MFALMNKINISVNFWKTYFFFCQNLFNYLLIFFLLRKNKKTLNNYIFIFSFNYKNNKDQKKNNYYN